MWINPTLFFESFNTFYSYFFLATSNHHKKLKLLCSSLLFPIPPLSISLIQGPKMFSNLEECKLMNWLILLKSSIRVLGSPGLLSIQLPHSAIHALIMTISCWDNALVLWSWHHASLCNLLQSPKARRDCVAQTRHEALST